MSETETKTKKRRGPAFLHRPQKPGESANGSGNGDGGGPLEVAKEGAIDLVGWVDERTAATGFLTGMLFRKVPKGTNWFYTLGSGTLFAFVFQALTGVFLAMYYVPSATEAYDSITHLTNDVFLGEFVRGMHKWGATVMMVLIFLHMGRTFFFGAYKYPRELNWIIGVILLVLTLMMGLTGLPAAVRPALLLGDDRRRQHQRHRAHHRPLPRRLPSRRPRVRGDDDRALLLDPHAARARRDHRPDRRPPLPRREAGDDGAAVEARRRQAEVAPRGEGRLGGRRSRDEQRREGAIPPRVRGAEEAGQALLPLRGAEGLGDGADRRRGDHRDVARPRRRAGPEGRPDDDHLRAAARSGTSSSSSSSCA